MKTYRNRFFQKRDYETTNLVACVAEEKPETPDNRWTLADPDGPLSIDLSKLTQLWIENGVRYFGHL